MASGGKTPGKVGGVRPDPAQAPEIISKSRAAGIEAEKTKLGIDDIVFDLCASMGKGRSKEEIKREIDGSIVFVLEQLGL